MTTLSVSLLSFLVLTLYPLYHPHLCVNRPNTQANPDWQQAQHLVLPQLYSRQSMADGLLSGYEHLHPKSLLSSEDLVVLLTRQFNKRISEDLKYEKELVKDDLKHERELTDDKIKILADKLGTISELFFNHIKVQNDKISDLDLKIETLSSYNEQLLHNLKFGLQDTFKSVQYDVWSLHTQILKVEEAQASHILT